MIPRLQKWESVFSLFMGESYHIRKNNGCETVCSAANLTLSFKLVLRNAS